MNKNGIVVRVDAGSTDRLNELVSFSVKPRLRTHDCVLAWFGDWQEGTYIRVGCLTNR